MLGFSLDFGGSGSEECMAQRKVVSIGLDACDPLLAREFAERGLMPNLAQLLREASNCTVVNPFGLFAAAVWVNYATAIRIAKHGYHWWEKIEPSTYRKANSPP